MADNFDWNDDDVVLKGFLSVAVYPNDDGDIVIRQQADGYCHEEDPWVVVPLRYASIITDAIANAVAIAIAIASEVRR